MKNVTMSTPGDVCALNELIYNQADWSIATFGGDDVRGPIGPLKHMVKEILCELLGMDRAVADKVLSDLLPNWELLPLTIDEFADLLILLLDSSRRAGFSFWKVVEAGVEKMKENRGREWPAFDPSKVNEAVEHVREPVKTEEKRSRSWPIEESAAERAEVEAVQIPFIEDGVMVFRVFPVPPGKTAEEVIAEVHKAHEEKEYTCLSHSPGHAGYLALLDEMRELHLKKAADYGTDGDPLSNLRDAESIGIPNWKGAWLRAQDKVKRIKKFCTDGKLENESVEDSFKDLAAYSLLALALFREQNK